MKKPCFYSSLICYGLSLLAFIGIDRFTKYLAFNKLMQKSVSVIPGLDLSLTFNRGVAFGLFSSHKGLYFWGLGSLIISILVFFGIYTFMEYKKGRNIFFHIILIAGAFSNIWDRFLYGGVVDFIDIYVANWHWPTFNVADIFVVIGILGLFAMEFFYGVTD